jgi:hypothetical protein
MNIKKLLVLLSFAMSIAIYVKAQTNLNYIYKATRNLQTQADSIKLLFKQQGFSTIKEKAIVMESQYEFPVVLPLTEGTWYRVVFIGDFSSRLYELRMFDWNEKQVIYQKKMWGDVDGNVINYDFIPRFSEYYMIKPLQINKHRKTVDGYMLLFKKIIKP